MADSLSARDLSIGLAPWFWLIARCSIGSVASFGLLLPVFALISSAERLAQFAPNAR